MWVSAISNSSICFLNKEIAILNATDIEGDIKSVIHKVLLLSGSAKENKKINTLVNWEG